MFTLEEERRMERNEMYNWVKALLPYMPGAAHWNIDEKWKGLGIHVVADCCEDLRLSFYRVLGNKERVAISGEFFGYEGHLPPDSWKVKITVAMHRKPQSVAKDIERRLLPKCQQVLAQARQNKIENEKRIQEKENAMKVLADALPYQPYIWNDNIRVYQFHNFEARWQSYDKTFKVTVEVPIKKALEIIELLKEDN